MGVDVAELEGAVAGRGGDLVACDAGDLEVVLDRLAEGLLAGGVESADEAMGREDGEPGILEGDEAPQDVAGGACAAGTASAGVPSSAGR